MLLSAGTADVMELSKLPDEMPLSVRYDGVSFSPDARTFMPLPSLDEAPISKIVRTSLPDSFFYDGALRSRRRFSFSGLHYYLDGCFYLFFDICRHRFIRDTGKSF